MTCNHSRLLANAVAQGLSDNELNILADELEHDPEADNLLNSDSNIDLDILSINSSINYISVHENTSIHLSMRFVLLHSISCLLYV
jgi:hypothetical protein